MTIAIYIAYHNIDKGGIFTYSNTLIRLLSKSSVINKLIIIHSPDQKIFLSDYASKNNKIKLRQTSIRDRKFLNFLYNLSMALISFSNISKEIPGFFEKIGNLINPFNYLFRRIPCDLIHIPFQFAPIYKSNKPIILSMHDLQEFHYPEFFSAYERIERAIRYKIGIEKTSGIIVSFDHVKSDIIKYFNIPADRISVCPIAMSLEWNIAVQPQPSSQVADKFNLPSSFILYPAQTWPHKNHKNLFLALKQLKNKGSVVNLVCTGHKNTHYDSLKQLIGELGLSEQINFLGMVSEEELAALYKMTSLVVIPTLYEAGSGPLFEAMHNLTPVICSNVTSLPETIGNPKFIFDPNKPDEIASMINTALTDKTFIEQNIANSKSRIAFYSGFDFIEPFVNAYTKTLS